MAMQRLSERFKLSGPEYRRICFALAEMDKENAIHEICWVLGTEDLKRLASAIEHRLERKIQPACAAGYRQPHSFE